MSATLTPFDFSFPTDDDECQFGTLSLNDPFTDLFDQLVNQDSSDFSDSLNGSDVFTDSTSSGSCTDPSKPNGPFPTKNFPSREVWQDNDPFVHFKSSSISKTYQPCNTANGVGAAVSGTELLNIEGLLPYEPSFLDSAFSPPTTPAVPAIPRKSKSHGALNSSHQLRHKISKGQYHMLSGSHRMMRPSYYYRHEAPSPKEWQEQFDRYSLQSPALSFPLSPPPSFKAQQGEFPIDVLVQSDKHMQATRSSNTQLERTRADVHLEPRSKSYQQRIEQRRMQNGVANNMDKDFIKQEPNIASSTNHQFQPTSWNEPSTIPRGQEEPQWLSDFALPTTEAAIMDTSFASQGLMINSDPFSDFDIQDPSSSYHIETPYQLPPITPMTPNQPYQRRTPSPASSRSPSPTSTRRLRHRRKSSSHIPKSRSRTPKTPRTPRDASGFGFVNFTPSDSRKILTGVAPSGSSKTKARREMEACERTKRLSLAAIRAVREAGGDVERLSLGLGVGVCERDEEDFLG